MGLFHGRMLRYLYRLGNHHQFAPLVLTEQ
jgi:hypothetical protein